MGVGERVEAMLPLSQTATNMILSNVSSVMTDKFLYKQLFGHGKIVSRGEMSGYKSLLLKHIVPHHRQLDMILNKCDLVCQRDGH